MPRLSNNPSVFENQSTFPPALSEANNKVLETATNTGNVTLPNEILTVTDCTVVEQQPPVSQTNQTFQPTQVQLNLNSDHCYRGLRMLHRCRVHRTA